MSLFWKELLCEIVFLQFFSILICLKISTINDKKLFLNNTEDIILKEVEVVKTLIDLQNQLNVPEIHYLSNGQLFNGWKNFSGGGNAFEGPRFFKENNGIVHIEGIVCGGLSGSTNFILQLPTEFRPTMQKVFIQSCKMLGQANGIGCRVDVKTNGRVFVWEYSNLAGLIEFLSLDGIVFLVH